MRHSQRRIWATQRIPQRFDQLHQASAVRTERLGRGGAIAPGATEQPQNRFATIAIDGVVIAERFGDSFGTIADHSRGQMMERQSRIALPAT